MERNVLVIIAVSHQHLDKKKERIELVTHGVASGKCEEVNKFKEQCTESTTSTKRGKKNGGN